MTETLRAILPALQFWQLEAHVWLLAGLSVLELPALVKSVGASRWTWASALSTAALALGLAAGVAPRTSRIYYDEQIYQHIGQNMADRHRAEMCNEGRMDAGRLECARPEYNKQPNGYPHLLSVGYRLFGVRDRLAWAVNNACAALLPIVVFLAAAVVASGYVSAGTGTGAPRWVAAAPPLAALVAALTPQQLLWSNTAAVEPSAALAGAVAVTTAVWFVHSRRTSALIWAVAATSYACQFRPESLLIVVVVAGVIVLGARGEFLRPRVWVAAGLGAILALPLAMHMMLMGNQGWGTTGPRLSLSFLAPNLAVNGPFYFSNVRFPAACTVLALVGVAATWRRALGPIWLLYFGLFWGVFLVFYAGSYDYGADVRYSLMTYPPVALAAGFGAAWIAGRLPRRGPAILALGLLAQFTWFLPLVRATGEEAWMARADVAAARSFASLVPDDAIVLTHNPSMFLLWGTSAAQMSIAVRDQDFVPAYLSRRHAGGVYLHWNFWCEVPDPSQAGFCTAIRDRFDMELVAERRERDKRFALYRLR